MQLITRPGLVSEEIDDSKWMQVHCSKQEKQTALRRRNVWSSFTKSAVWCLVITHQLCNCVDSHRTQIDDVFVYTVISKYKTSFNLWPSSSRRLSEWPIGIRRPRQMQNHRSPMPATALQSANLHQTHNKYSDFQTSISIWLDSFSNTWARISPGVKIDEHGVHFVLCPIRTTLQNQFKKFKRYFN